MMTRKAPSVEKTPAEKSAGKVEKWIAILIVTIIIQSSSSVIAIWQAAHNHSDIEYVRTNAVKKTAIEAIQEALKIRNEGIYMLVDSTQRAAVKYIDARFNYVLDQIVSWNSVIEPRGIVESREKKSNLTFSQ